LDGDDGGRHRSTGVLNADADPPQGLIVHTGVETDGGARIVDVWESREAFERFRPSVQAAAAAVAQRNGIEARPPVNEIFDTFEVVRGRA
jgi:heme-degrading monooxygenase HmoA